LQDPPKFTQIGIFGLKINHLATLVGEAHPLPSERSTSVTRLGEISPFLTNIAN
jgi:hypothetical protein